MTRASLHRLLASAVVVAALAATTSRVSTSAGDSLAFHHLHLNDSRSPLLLQFYERLFDPATTRRLRIADSDGLQSGPMLLLIRATPLAPAAPSALWHFGWGDVSLGETYLAHAAREVAWEPPLPPDRLHLHIRSVSPPAAIAWYRDVLGARVELPASSTATRSSEALPRPEQRMPEALVWIGALGLLIYRTDPPLLSSRGQTVDHLALSCADLDAAVATLKAAGVSVIDPPSSAGGIRSAMIEAPDRLAIELVEAR